MQIFCGIRRCLALLEMPDIKRLFTCNVKYGTAEPRRHMQEINEQSTQVLEKQNFKFNPMGYLIA